MMVDLRTTIARVRAGLAQIDAEVGPYPSDWSKSSNWHALRHAALEQLAEQLRAECSARINARWDGCAVTIAGIRSTSTGGLAGALNNWCRAAERKLEGGA